MPSLTGFYALFEKQQRLKTKKKSRQKKTQTKRQKTSPCQIENLADDTWHMIFQFLSFEDNIQLEQTCQLFHKIIDRYGIVTNDAFVITYDGIIDDENEKTCNLIERYVAWFMIQQIDPQPDVPNAKFKCPYIKEIWMHPYGNHLESDLNKLKQNIKDKKTTNNLPINYYDFLQFVNKIDCFCLQLACKDRKSLRCLRHKLSRQCFQNLSNVKYIQYLQIDMQSYAMSELSTYNFNYHTNNSNNNNINNYMFENVQETLDIRMITVDDVFIEMLNNLNVSEFYLGQPNWEPVHSGRFLYDRLSFDVADKWSRLKKISLWYQNLPEPIWENQNYHLNYQLLNAKYLEHVTLSFYLLDELTEAMVPQKIASQSIKSVQLVLADSSTNIFWTLFELFTANNHKLNMFAVKIRRFQLGTATITLNHLKIFKKILTSKCIKYFDITSNFDAEGFQLFVGFFTEWLEKKWRRAIRNKSNFNVCLNKINPKEDLLCIAFDEIDIDEYYCYLKLVIIQLLNNNSTTSKFFKLIGLKQIFVFVNFMEAHEMEQVKNFINTIKHDICYEIRCYPFATSLKCKLAASHCLQISL